MGGYRKFTSVLLVLVTSLALVAAACSDDGSVADGRDASTTAMPTDTGTTSSSAPTASPIPPGPLTVEVAETDAGEVLTDGDGRTLYVYLADHEGDPACIEACLDTWLPVYVTGEPKLGSGVDENVVATAKRDGNQQLIVGGQYVYRYAGDVKAGDANGQGVESLWYMLAPDGTRIVGVG